MLVICVTVLALKAEMLASCADLWASKEVASVSILAGLSSGEGDVLVLLRPGRLDMQCN